MLAHDVEHLVFAQGVIDLAQEDFLLGLAAGGELV
jgi:hypothetical protein